MREVSTTKTRYLFPDENVYTAGSTVVYIEDLTRTAGRKFKLSIWKKHPDNTWEALLDIVHTVDATFKTMFDVSEILRGLSEANGWSTITDLYFECAPTGDTQQFAHINIIAGLCLSAPVWQTPTMLRNVLSTAQEVLVDFGSAITADLQVLSGGTWSTVRTYNVAVGAPTNRVMQITENFDFLKDAVRLITPADEIIWQAILDHVKQPCELRRLVNLRWRSDTYEKIKNVWFQVVNVERKQTEKVSLMYQSGEIEHNGQYANERRNWSYYITVRTEAVTPEELRYFEDLFTSPEVTMITSATGVQDIGGGSRVAIDGSSKLITYKPQRARLQFGLLVSKFWSV